METLEEITIQIQNMNDKVDTAKKVLPNWLKLIGILLTVIGFVGFYFFKGIFGVLMVLGIILAIIGFKWNDIIGG